jgi:hypothetical protein
MSGNCGKISSLRTSSMEEQSSPLFKRKRNSPKQEPIFVHSSQNIVELPLAKSKNTKQVHSPRELFQGTKMYSRVIIRAK